MQSFIVLGIIPGTNIQTNLDFWIWVSIMLSIFACRNLFFATGKLVLKFLALHQIAYTIRHYEFVVVQ